MIETNTEVNAFNHGNSGSGGSKFFDAAYEGLKPGASRTTDFSPALSSYSEYTAEGTKRASDAYLPPFMVADAARPAEADSTAQPADAATDKKARDTSNLPPELQREAALMENINGQQRAILEAAFNNVNQKVWARSRFADLTANGAYGCAAAESVVSQEAGYHYADNPLVSGFMNQLMKNGWTKHSFDDRQPGDKVIKHTPGSSWKKGGGKAHIGTVGADIDYAYNNDSATGQWQYEPINDVFTARNKRFVLRPPANGDVLLAHGK